MISTIIEPSKDFKIFVPNAYFRFKEANQRTEKDQEKCRAGFKGNCGCFRRKRKMKRLFGVVFSLLLACSVFAQQRTGNIYGQVVDSDGQPLPGATVTLTGRLTAPVSATTSDEGRFRFMSLSPARDYVLRPNCRDSRPSRRRASSSTSGRTSRSLSPFKWEVWKKR